jgi:hypothetical protein
MEKQLNLTLIDSESHCYLRVNKDTFFQFKLNGSEFSEYSYYNNNNFYLEFKTNYFLEDCDAVKFINIVKNKGYKINFINKYNA